MKNENFDDPLSPEIEKKMELFKGLTLNKKERLELLFMEYNSLRGQVGGWTSAMRKLVKNTAKRVARYQNKINMAREKMKEIVAFYKELGGDEALYREREKDEK